MKKYLRIIYCITLCLALGFLSGKITQSSINTWYPLLIKPFFNPPNWVFAPVWTLLFIFMGTAAGLIWNEWDKNEKVVKNALLFFIVQLALNALWSYLFFGLNNTLLASLEIVVLFLLIYETYLKFKTINKKASYLLVPYLIWVGFASVLTWSIWFLNSF